MRKLEKEEAFREKLNSMNPIKKAIFMKKFTAKSIQAYNSLCLNCRMKVMRTGGGYIQYCKKCKDKANEIMKEVYDELK